MFPFSHIKLSIVCLVYSYYQLFSVHPSVPLPLCQMGCARGLEIKHPTIKLGQPPPLFHGHPWEAVTILLKPSTASWVSHFPWCVNHTLSLLLSGSFDSENLLKLNLFLISPQQIEFLSRGTLFSHNVFLNLVSYLFVACFVSLFLTLNQFCVGVIPFCSFKKGQNIGWFAISKIFFLTLKKIWRKFVLFVSFLF